MEKYKFTPIFAFDALHRTIDSLIPAPETPQTCLTSTQSLAGEELGSCSLCQGRIEVSGAVLFLADSCAFCFASLGLFVLARSLSLFPLSKLGAREGLI